MNFIIHIWPVYHTHHIPSDRVNGVDLNILLKLHTLAVPKNAHYFLKLNNHVETIILTLESV